MEKKKKKSTFKFFRLSTLHKNEILHVFLAIVFVFSSLYIASSLDQAKAASNNWDFTTAGDYTYDSDKIEFSNGVAQLKQENWYDAGYSLRKSITIDRAKVSSTFETNFQVLINTTDTDLKDTTNGGGVGQSDGGDIVFTNFDGQTKLDFEKESYTSTTGALTYWIEVPTVNGTGASTDTVIYMYYGSSTVADQWNAEATWGSEYLLVQHMNEDPSGGAPQMIDSTSNSTDGTSAGAMEIADLVAGQVGNAIEFNGSTQYIDLSSNVNNIEGYTAGTITGWFKTSDTACQRIFSLTDSSVSDYALIGIGGCTGQWSNESIGYYHNKGGSIDIFMAAREGHTAYQDGTWRHLALVMGNGDNAFYINGVKKSVSFDFGGSVSTNQLTDINGQNAAAIGAANAGSWSTFFNGIIDEIRLSTTPLSTNTISSQYNNQKYPDKGDHGASGFYTVGSEVATTYFTDSPTVVNNTGLTFTKTLASLSETLASDSAGSVTYQVSNDGTNWYYYDNQNWVSASGVSQSNAASVLDANLITFVDDVGTGDFYFKAFLTGDGTQLTKLSAVSVLYDTPGGGSSPDEVEVISETEPVIEEISEEIAEEEVEEEVEETVYEGDDALEQENTDLKSKILEQNSLIEELRALILTFEDEIQTLKQSKIIVYGPYLDDFIRFGNGTNDPESILKLLEDSFG